MNKSQHIVSVVRNDGRITGVPSIEITESISKPNKEIIKNNLKATRDPTANDDNSCGWQISSMWANIVTQNIFINIGANKNKAVWICITNTPKMSSLEIPKLPDNLTSYCVADRAPTLNDSDWTISTTWIDKSVKKAYLLIDNSPNLAMWKVLTQKNVVTDSSLSGSGLTGDPLGINNNQNIFATLTTDETPTSLAVIPVKDNSTIMLSALISARQADNSKCAGYELKVVINRNNGNAPVIEKTDIVFATSTNWNVSVIPFGNNIMIQAIGEVGANISWKLKNNIIEAT